MNRIAEYIEGLDFNSFKKDYKTVDAIIRNFEIIGEASKNLPDLIKQQNAKIPWQEMYYLRNKVSHEYFGIDYEIIWDVAKNYLPVNLAEVEKILNNLSKKEDWNPAAKTIKLLVARRIHVIVLQLDQINITSTAGKLLLAMLESLAALDEKFRTGRRRPVSEEDLPGLKRVVRNRTLSEQQRQQVLVRLNTGESIKELARVFGVTRIQIMRINTGSE